MKAYDIYVPLTLNDGSAVSESTLDQIEQGLIDTFGGFTAGPECRGAWRDDDGKVYIDRIRPYTLFAEDQNTVLATAAHLAAVLDQFCVSVITPDRHALLIDRHEIVRVA